MWYLLGAHARAHHLFSYFIVIKYYETSFICMVLTILQSQLASSHSLLYIFFFAFLSFNYSMEVIKILNPIVMFMDVCGGSASK